MRATHLLAAAATLAVVAIAPQPATARKAYLEQAIKQFDLPASTAQTPGCQYCHTSRFGGQGWNKFGDRVRVHHGGEAKGDIGQALYLALKDNKDSDGDGFTDLQEVADKTYPGDAKSKPTEKTAELDERLKKLGGVDNYKPAAKR